MASFTGDPLNDTLLKLAKSGSQGVRVTRLSTVAWHQVAEPLLDNELVTLDKDGKVYLNQENPLLGEHPFTGLTEFLDLNLLTKL